MPRVSSATKDAFTMSLGFQPGYGEVVAAEYVIDQFEPSKKTGEQQPPACFLNLTLQRYTDETFNEKTQDEPVVEQWKVAGPSKEDGTFHIRPGIAESREDPDVKDVDENGALGSTGNTLYCDKEGFKYSKSGKYGLLMTSLEKAGFKPAILQWSYAPDFIGLKAEWDNTKMNKIDPHAEKDPVALTVKRCFNYPYEQAAGAAGKGKGGRPKADKAESASAPKPNGSATSTPAQAPAGGDTDDIAAEALFLAQNTLSTIHIESRGQTWTKQRLALQTLNRIVANPEYKGNKPLIKAVQGMIMKAGFLDEQAAAVGYEVKGDQIAFV